MKIAKHPDGTMIEQGSVDWMIARAGIPTASEFDQLVTPDFKVRTGDMPKSYLAKKLAEAWQGGPLISFNTFDMDQGKVLEEEAIPWFESEFNEFSEPVERVGLVTTDDGRIGCSPDGLLKDSGIEIKCPRAETQVAYLLAGVLPKDYRAQVHGAMFVTERTSWKFLSYRRRFPHLLLTIERDDEIQKVLAEALAGFLDAFDEGMKRLIEINGGPPPRRSKAEPATPQRGLIDPDDIVP